MRKILILGLTLAALAGASASPAAETHAQACSDYGYLTAAIKVEKKNVAALKLAQRGKYGLALTPARTALTWIKRSPVPCDEGTDQYWLHRQYSIKYDVALVRYLEEMRLGNYDRADVYWASVEFWGDEKTDITYAW